MSPSDHSAATSKTAPAAVPPQSTAPTQSAERTAPNAARRRLTELLESPSTGIWIATGVLFLLSWILQPQSVRQSALLGMLPFAGVLAIAAMGQTLVIQQGGIDLSVPGMVSVTVVIMTRYPNGDSGKLAVALLLAFAITLLAGLLSGTLVSRVGVTPIVATLGMNALLYGAVLEISHGTPRTTTNALFNFASGKFLGIPNTVVIAVVLTAGVGFLIKKTVVGRRFEAVGAGLFGARAAGLETRRYQLGAYVGAAALYCAAGVLLAGVVSTPSVFQGDSYLLPSVAAVVLGGTSLLGGRGSVVATAVAALFITQLDQFVLVTGAKPAVQNLVDAAALAAGVAIYSVPWRRLIRALRRRSNDRDDGAGRSTEVGLTSHVNQGAQLAPRPNE
jgi:ribose transport system permease protein